MLNVKHFLDIYSGRKRMFEEGLTNPLTEIKGFISELVEKLSLRNPYEKVDLLRNENGILELKNKNGEIIITFPDFENLAKENNIIKL